MNESAIVEALATGGVPGALVVVLGVFLRVGLGRLAGELDRLREQIHGVERQLRERLARLEAKLERNGGIRP